MRLLVFLYLFTRMGRSSASRNDSHLVESLRKQLMNDNYDYMEASDDSDQLTLRPPLARNELPVVRGVEDEYSDLAEGCDNNNIQKTRRQNVDSFEKPSIPVNNKDLMYYIDDGILHNQLLEKFHETQTDAEITTTARYRLLEVRMAKNGRSGRRSGAGGGNKTRRFLQEEKPGEVSILNLDEGPFPEFRLPADRRQYMGDYHSEDDTDEMPPPLSLPPELAVLTTHAPVTPVPERQNRAPFPGPVVMPPSPNRGQAPSSESSESNFV